MRLGFSAGPRLLQPYCNPSAQSLVHRVGELIAHAGQHLTLTVYDRTWLMLTVSRRWERIAAEHLAQTCTLARGRFNILWEMLSGGPTFEDRSAARHFHNDSPSRGLRE